MKISYYKLDAHLEKGKLARAYIVTGDEDLLREQAVRDLVSAAVGSEPSPFNLERLDGEEVDGAEIATVANTMPMLGGRRALVVKRATALVEKDEVLPKYLDDPAPYTVLILDLSKKPDQRRKAWKHAEKHATVVTCEAPKPIELENWVAEQARSRNLKLGREGIRYLIAEFGGDMRRLSNELEKLSLYALGDRLDLETIATVLGRGRAQSIFKFVDAVGAGETGSALRQLSRLMEEGEPALRILALLDRLVGQLRIAKEAGGGRSLASLLGIPPFAAKNVAENARRFDAARLESAVRMVSEADRTLKSSRLPDRLVLETLVISLCRGEGGGGEAATAQLAMSLPRRRARRDL
jgi:DNA polymerase-3 subunit delta